MIAKEFPRSHSPTPPSLGAQLGKSSSIDILALKNFSADDFSANRPPKFFDGLILFFIECKRADPKVKDWIFTKDPGGLKLPTFFTKTLIPANSPHGLYYEIARNVCFPNLNYKRTADLDFCLQGTEFKSGLTDINRDKDEIIYKPLLQANHALNAIFRKSAIYPPQIEGLNFPLKKTEKILFLPVVVTTANLYVANYNPKEVDSKTGKIEEKNISFGEPKPYITYEFPLPDYLKYSGKKTYNTFERREIEELLDIERSTTFIVNSEYWEKFLKVFDIWGLN